MKIKKEAVKKIKAAPNKKVVAKVRTVSATKKVVKKTKVVAAPKRTIKKTKTIASSKKIHVNTLTNKASTKPTRKIMWRLKRITYMILALVVGALSAGILLGFIEKIYLKNILNIGRIPVAHQFLGMQLFLFPTVYVLIFGAGLCFGAWLGFWGWRVVYVEHRHRMFQKK